MSTLALLLLAWLGPPTQSKLTPPPLLLRAAQCLAAKEFLPQTKSNSLTLGYVLDEKSYPGEKALFVVSFAAPTGSDGFVFTLFLTERGTSQTFDIQNHAQFVVSSRDPSGISFVAGADPLGGIWTQQHLASAIKQIELQPRFTVSPGDLAASNASIHCAAYTDQPGKDSER